MFTFTAMQVLLIESILSVLRDWRAASGLRIDEVYFEDVRDALLLFFRDGNKVNAIKALRELSCQHPLASKIAYPNFMCPWAETKLRAAVSTNARSKVLGLKESKDLLDWAETNWSK